MTVTTRFETGDTVYAVHPCRIICGGQIILNEEILRMESDGADHKQTYAEDIYIASPHEVRNITASCNKGFRADILYELSGGIMRSEKNIFASLEDAAEYAAGLYEKSAGKYNGSASDEVETGVLKEMVCKKLQQSLKAVLSYEQLERFEEEFRKLTQGMAFSTAEQVNDLIK